MKKSKLLKLFLVLVFLIALVLIFAVNVKSNTVKNMGYVIQKNFLGNDEICRVTFLGTDNKVLYDTYIEKGFTLITNGEESEEDKTFLYKGKEPIRETYTFDKWISSTGSFVITEDTSFTAHFIQDKMYVISAKYIKENGTIASDTYVEVFEKGSNFSIKSPEVQGYTPDIDLFEGVITEENLENLKNQENITIQNYDSENICRISINIVYRPSVSSYKINHMKQNISGTDYELFESETITDNVKVEDVITPQGKEKSYEGFKLNANKSESQETVKADGTTEINIYYDRINYFIYYDTQGGTYFDEIPALYGARINVTTETPIRDGYTFSGWKYYKKDNNGNKQEISLPSVMEAYDLYLVAQWKAKSNQYNITYWRENANDDEFTNIGTYAVSGVTSGQNIVVNNIDLKIDEGFTSIVGTDKKDYFYYDKNKTLSSNASSIKVKDDGTANINVYYKRNKYTLRFLLSRVENGQCQINTNANASSEDLCNWYTVNLQPKIIMDGKIYLNREYTITAKYEENISSKWPIQSDMKDIDAQDGSYSWIAWIPSGESEYYKKHQENYRIFGRNQIMSEELIVDKTNSNVEHLLIARFDCLSSLGILYYKFHYMYESLDQTSGVAYTNTVTGKTKYYKEETMQIIRALAERKNVNAGDRIGVKLLGKTYTGDPDSRGEEIQEEAPDIYFYYDREEYKLNFYNVNKQYIPTSLSQNLAKQGITLRNGEIYVKYGSNISAFGEEYKLWLNNEQNKLKNPLTTLGNREWEFEGWYRDANYTAKFDWNSSILTNTIDNRTIYAKWKAPTYNVTYDLNGGNWNESAEKELQISEGEKLTKPEEPTRTGYIFEGWYYTKNINGKDYEVEYLFSDSQAVYSDIKLTAKWTSIMKTSYKVRYIRAEFDSNGELIEDIGKYQNIEDLHGAKEVQNVSVGTTVTEDAIDLKANKLYVVKNRTKSLNIENDNIDDNTIYFFYTEMEELHYKVYYVIDNGTLYENGEIPEEEMQLAEPCNGLITNPEELLIEAEALDIPGYVPNAWTKTLLPVSEEKNNTIYFYYQENSQKGHYKINFYFMNELDGYSNPIVVEGDKGVGAFIQAKDYNKYLDESNSNYENHIFDEELSDKVGIVNEANETVINLYFKNQTYKVTYNLQDGIWKDENNIYIEKDNNYETEVSYVKTAPKPEEPTRDGYEFLGWYELENGKIKEYTFEEQISKETNLYALWKETKEIEIAVVWEDDNNRDGIRPESLNIDLLQDGKLLKTIELAENKQQAQIERQALSNLKWETKIIVDKYNYDNYSTVFISEDNGIEKITNNSDNFTKIEAVSTSDKLVEGARLEDVMIVRQYSISQGEVSGYNPVIEQNILTITNTHTPEKVNKTIEIEWDDKNNSNNTRPVNIEIALLANNEEVESTILSNANNWTHTFNNLNKKEDGTEIEYKIKEIGDIANYTTTYSEDKWKIKNTLNDYNYKVEWYDAEKGTKIKEQTRTARYGDTVTVKEEDKVISGYVFDENNKNSIVTSRVENDELVLKLYFIEERFTYTLSYDANEGENAPTTQTETSTNKQIEFTIPAEKPNKTGYKFLGWSEKKAGPVTYKAGETITINKNTTLYAVWELDETQTKEISYKIEYYKDKVKADEETVTNEVHILKPNTIKVDKTKINITNKYDGYKFIKTEPVQIPEMVNDGEIIKVYYEKRDKKVVVKYVNKVTGQDIVAPVEKMGCLGEEYDITTEEKDIPGYELLESPESKIGVFKEEVQTKVYYYAKKTSVIVKYLEKGTQKELLPQETIEGYEGLKYNVRRKDISGYVFVERPANAEGEMTADPITITFYYIQISKGVIEKHIDVKSNEVLYSETHTGNEGDPYEILKREFKEYDIIESQLPANSTGVMTKDTIEVRYYYIRKTKVVVEYKDRDTNEKIVSDMVINGHEGDSYKAEQKKLKGYKIVETATNESGTMTKEEIKVTYYYKKIPAEVIEKHIDINTNKVLDSKVYTGYEGDSYKTGRKEFEGYDLVESKLPSNASGTMTETAKEVIYYYARKTKVIVEYRDKITKEKIKEDFVIEGHEGDTYKVEEKDIKGFKLLEKPEKLEGIMKVSIKDDGTIETTKILSLYYENDGTSVDNDKINDSNKNTNIDKNNGNNSSNKNNQNEETTLSNDNKHNNNTVSTASIVPDTGDLVPTIATSIIIFVLMINGIQYASTVEVSKLSKGKHTK